MDHLRVLLVPFHPTNLLTVGIFSALVTFCLSLGFYGWFPAWFLQVWLFKYCYVLVERVADGATEPPVMETEMLSPLEIRPWVQAILIFGGGWICYRIGGTAGLLLAAAMLALLPATVAILGFGEAPWQSVNPVTWFRVIRGLGPYYALLLGALLACVGVFRMMARLELWLLLENAIQLWFVVAFFSLVGACLFLRRKELGFDPSRSPERTAAREETQRLKLRAKMVDEVFQLVRIGKHVDATAPLAKWLRDLDAEKVSSDAYYVAEQAVRWDSAAALNPIGSTLIRHLMRFGRPDAALSVFEVLRTRHPNFTMDSAADLRALAEFADSSGREGLAQSMRLETPVFHPER